MKDKTGVGYWKNVLHHGSFTKLCVFLAICPAHLISMGYTVLFPIFSSTTEPVTLPRWEFFIFKIYLGYPVVIEGNFYTEVLQKLNVTEL